MNYWDIIIRSWHLCYDWSTFLVLLALHWWLFMNWNIIYSSLYSLYSLFLEYHFKVELCLLSSFPVYIYLGCRIRIRCLGYDNSSILCFFNYSIDCSTIIGSSVRVNILWILIDSLCWKESLSLILFYNKSVTDPIILSLIEVLLFNVFLWYDIKSIIIIIYVILWLW